jgi:hypothetical protein
MGLDGVEIILRVEEEFAISLEDDELFTTKTVGELYALVLSKLETTPSCLSSKAFYVTRKVLTEVLHVSKRSMRPSTHLAEFFPEETRRARWQQVAYESGLEFPRLLHSYSQKVNLRTTSVIAASLLLAGTWIAGGIAGWHPSLSFGIFGLGSVFWIISFALFDNLLIRWTSLLRNEIPVVTAGELSTMVLVMNPDAFSAPQCGPPVLTKEGVWAKLVQIFCDQQGLSPQEIVPEARIVQDLGID